MEHGMAGRSARECHDRWMRYLRPGRMKGQWTEQEDAIVLRAIFSGGFSSRWQDLVPQLPGRNSEQIRIRWVNFLNPALNILPFSRNDDRRLWWGHKELGKRWVDIGVKVFQSTRSDWLIRKRWSSVGFKEFVAKEFGAEAYDDANRGWGPLETADGGKGHNNMAENRSEVARGSTVITEGFYKYVLHLATTIYQG